MTGCRITIEFCHEGRKFELVAASETELTVSLKECMRASNRDVSAGRSHTQPSVADGNSASEAPPAPASPAREGDSRERGEGERPRVEAHIEEGGGGQEARKESAEQSATPLARKDDLPELPAFLRRERVAA